MPKPLPKPEPMEVDQSIRTRSVNYQNRQAFNQFNHKRIPNTNSQQAHVPQKYQRIFNTEEQSDQDTKDDQANYYSEQYEERITQDQNFDQPLTEYIDPQNDLSLDPPEFLTDIHFLD